MWWYWQPPQLGRLKSATPGLTNSHDAGALYCTVKFSCRSVCLSVHLYKKVYLPTYTSESSESSDISDSSESSDSRDSSGSSDCSDSSDQKYFFSPNIY